MKGKYARYAESGAIVGTLRNTKQNTAGRCQCRARAITA